MAFGETTSDELERIAKQIVDGCFKVHTRLGPGCLESTYKLCLYHELLKRGLHVEKELDMPVEYDGVILEAGYRIDLLVERQIIIEAKAVERMLPIFKAQTITYLKLAKLKLAFLVNFNVEYIRDGIERVVLSKQ